MSRRLRLVQPRSTALHYLLRRQRDGAGEDDANRAEKFGHRDDAGAAAAARVMDLNRAIVLFIKRPDR